MRTKVFLVITCAALVLGGLAMGAQSANAQTVYNPRTIQFDSPDNATVSSYTVEFWLQGVDPTTGKPVSSYSIDKSKIVASGLAAPLPQLQGNFSDFAPVPAIPIGSTYVARMLAVGLDPTLVSARSDPSNPFASAGAPRGVVNMRVK